MLLSLSLEILRQDVWIIFRDHTADSFSCCTEIWAGFNFVGNDPDCGIDPVSEKPFTNSSNKLSSPTPASSAISLKSNRRLSDKTVLTSGSSEAFNSASWHVSSLALFANLLSCLTLNMATSAALWSRINLIAVKLFESTSCGLSSGCSTSKVLRKIPMVT